MLLLGLLQGYWTVYLCTMAEQFGSNLRATVTTLVPNLARAAAVPVMLATQALVPLAGLVGATLIVGLLVHAAALAALATLAETYGRDLDYVER
jgi:hypothetical protein